MAGDMLTLVDTSSQIDAVARLATEIWREHYTPIIGAAQVEYMLTQFQSPTAITHQITHEHYKYYLLETEGAAQGYLAIQPQGDCLFLSKLYVRAAARARGHARAAIHFAEQYAHQLQLKELALTVNRQNRLAITIYERLGFINAGPIVTDIGDGFVMDDYRMEKPL